MKKALADAGRDQRQHQPRREAVGSPRQDITLEERMGIAVAAAANRGVYGVVSGLAREYRTSRQFVYTLEKKVVTAVEEALVPRKPGPIGAPYLLEVDREHLDRSILTMAMVGHASERAIAECLGAVLRVEPSLGYVSGVLARASQAASHFNEGLHLSLPKADVGIDELYAQKKGNLVAIHPDSLLILALKETKKVDGQSWGETIDEMAHPAMGERRSARWSPGSPESPTTSTCGTPSGISGEAWEPWRGRPMGL
jgi:hypothetical protein